MFTADEGYYFGLGAFETIAVEEGKPVFLKEHYERLLQALKFFDLQVDFEEIQRMVHEALGAEPMQTGRKVLKITVSQKNLVVSTRENTYREEDYRQGFTAAYAKIRRNETSPLTYHKTLNYGDCILEKRRAKADGIQEPVFLNTRGEIAEGATSNVFFVKDGQIMAPPLSCGMLPGILRQYLYQNYEIHERIILPTQVPEFQEMFVTNSLLGIMPVRQMEDFAFPSMETGRRLREEYRRAVWQSRTILSTDLEYFASNTATRPLAES